MKTATPANPIQAATLAARARTGDQSVSVQVKAGRFQIVRVAYGKGGKSTVAPLSDWLAGHDLIPALESL